MIVHDFGGRHKVELLAELSQILSSRYDGANEFLLSHDDGLYPLLTILIKGELAALYYTPGDGEAGYASTGGELGLESDGMTSFASGSAKQEIEISNRAVVALPKALDVARDFLKSRELPRSLGWLKL